MIVRSPRHSFVDFEQRPFNYILPVVNLYSMTFQLSFEMNSVDWNESYTLQLVSPDGNTVLADLPAEVGIITNACNWCAVTGVNTAVENYPVTVNSNPIITAGIYETFEDLAEAFRLSGFNIKATQFLYCCDTTGHTHYAVGTSAGTIEFDLSPGMQYITFAIGDNPNIFQNITKGTCFKYRFVNNTQGQYVDSNLFVYTGDEIDKYIIKVQYSCNEDAYGFAYPLGVYNTVYLPMRFYNPQYPETRKVYKKSNQQFKVLSASIESEYDAQAGMVTNAIHRRIMVMLTHDNITVTSVTVNGLIFKKEGEDYDIKWPEVNDYDESTRATADFKINVTFAGRNSNCERRLPCISVTEPPPPECVPVGIAGTIFLPDARQYEPYNASVQLTGSAPFELGDVSKPTWMNVAIDGNNVILTGTPTATSIDVSVNITVLNCGGQSATYSDTIDILLANGIHWTNDVEVPESDPTLQSWHDVQLLGQPNEVVTITCTSYTNDFGGTINFNNSFVTGVGNTFNFTLDANGLSPVIQVRLQGLSVAAVGHPYGMLAAFSISTAGSGNIGSPDIFQISKTFN